MSDLPSFSSESFGVQEPPRKKNRSCLVIGLVVLGLIFLCLFCCVAGFVVMLRQPVVSASVWIGGVGANSYETARFVVCDGSQAAAYTDELEAAGVVFNNISLLQDASTNNLIEATGEIQVDGTVQNWQATFYTSDGGSFPFSTCVDRIEANLP